MPPKYAQGDIVIIKTNDLAAGNVIVPGVIRYVETHGNSFHYEVNVFIDDGSSPADQENCKWWALDEKEIQAKVGHVEIEHPIEKKKGEYTFTGIRF